MKNRIQSSFAATVALVAGTLASLLFTANTARAGNPIVSANELSEATAAIVVDTRSEDEFKAGHIPGARWLDINAWYRKSAEANGLNDKAHWQSQVGALGIAPDSQVVVIGGPLPNSARAWWLLRYFGIGNTQLLDGGYAAWTEANLPVTQATETVTPTTPAIEFNREILATLDDVMPDALKQSKASVLDNRSLAEFSGTRGIGTRTGHIPSACHVEWLKFLGDDGKFLPREELRKILESSGVEAGQSVVALCQTGGRSSVGVLALEIAGFKNVRNYYVGWGEYAGVLAAPVEK